MKLEYKLETSFFKSLFYFQKIKDISFSVFHFFKQQLYENLLNYVLFMFYY